MQYSSWAACGSFGERSVTFPVVVRVSMNGCIIVLVGRVVMFFCAGACGVRRDMFAAVSGSVVVFKLGGLVQPGVK